jgi:hypothetical protein
MAGAVESAGTTARCGIDPAGGRCGGLRGCAPSTSSAKILAPLASVAHGFTMSGQQMFDATDYDDQAAFDETMNLVEAIACSSPMSARVSRLEVLQAIRVVIMRAAATRVC